jgi:hypothetical protein
MKRKSKNGGKAGNHKCETDEKRISARDIVMGGYNLNLSWKSESHKD